MSAEQTMAVRVIKKAQDLCQLINKHYAGIENKRSIWLKINLAKIEKKRKNRVIFNKSSKPS